MFMIISVFYGVFNVFVRGDNPRAIASGLFSVQTDKPLTETDQNF